MPPTNKSTLSSTLLKAAWFSVLLGLSMEVLLLAIAAAFSHSPSTQTMVADLVQKISWSTFVCTGIALGLGASKMRAQVMGLAGLIAAPMAFYVAKAAHKSLSQALAITEQVAATGPSPMLLAVLKGLEYGALGFLIGRLATRENAGLKQHVLTGCGVGVVFGGIIVYFMISLADPALPLLGIVSRIANELIFPIGCSVVLFAAQKLGDKGK